MESKDATVKSYRVRRGPTSLQSVDFSVVNGENYAFFHLKSPPDVVSFRHKFEGEPFQQQFVSSTYVNGKPMLIMRGAMQADALKQALDHEGYTLQPVVAHHALDAWRIRSILGVAGQTLQLASSFMRPITAENASKSIWRRLDTSTFVFAASNLSANAINFMYSKGQQADDPNQLRYLKQQVNRDLGLHMKQGEQAPDVDEHRLDLRPKKEEPRGLLNQTNEFMKKHSVAVGELGLRYLGAFGMAFPARHWQASLVKGQMPPLNSSSFKVYTGLSSIAGKTVALTAKIPDPFNPKPRTWLDELREKYSFLTGGLIETTSFATLAYDGFFNTRGENAKINGIQNPFTGKIHRDWLGGIGASMFTAGYIVRAWAKYGERHVNMDELYAHASDTLAGVEPDKVPQLTANVSARLAEHFKGKEGGDFATLYTHLANDFQKYHAPTLHVASEKIDKPVVSHSQTPGNQVQTADATLIRHELATHARSA